MKSLSIISKGAKNFGRVYQQTPLGAALHTYILDATVLLLTT